MAVTNTQNAGDVLPTQSGYDTSSAPSGGPEHAHEQGDVGGHHVIPLSMYFKVFAALMVLLVVTLAAAAVDFGHINPRLHFVNIVIAVGIAVIKAVLIILYFMHVRFSSKMTWVFAGAAFVFVLIMFGMTFSDYATRGWLPMPGK